MSLIDISTYIVLKNGKFDKTATNETLSVNKDHVTMIKNMTLNFDPADTLSKPVSKVTFSNGASIIIAQTDVSKLK